MFMGHELCRYYKEKEFTSDFCFGKTVYVDEKGAARYGRVIGEVFVDGVSLNRALVENGFAWWYVQYAKKDTDLGVLQEAAKKAATGFGKRRRPWRLGCLGEGNRTKKV